MGILISFRFSSLNTMTVFNDKWHDRGTRNKENPPSVSARGDASRFHHLSRGEDSPSPSFLPFLSLSPSLSFSS